MRQLERICSLDNLGDLDNLPVGSVIYVEFKNCPSRRSGFAFYCGKHPRRPQYEVIIPTLEPTLTLPQYSIFGDSPALRFVDGKLVYNVRGGIFYQDLFLRDFRGDNNLISKFVKLGLIPAFEHRQAR